MNTTNLGKRDTFNSGNPPQPPGFGSFERPNQSYQASGTPGGLPIPNGNGNYPVYFGENSYKKTQPNNDGKSSNWGFENQHPGNSFNYQNQMNYWIPNSMGNKNWAQNPNMATWNQNQSQFVSNWGQISPFQTSQSSAYPLSTPLSLRDNGTPMGMRGNYYPRGGAWNNRGNSSYVVQNYPPGAQWNDISNRSSQTSWEPKPLKKKLQLEQIGKLPVETFRDTIISEIFSHQVMVISGDTGCGKSTYIPLYIYMASLMKEGYENSKIICTQPRRMATQGVSNRVSSLLWDSGVRDPKLCGYHVGRDCREGPSTRIVFVTSGILLQRLVHNEDVLDNYRFIILDEVHERDIDSDFIMIYLKSTLHKHPKTHLILMSATINTTNLSKYFAKEAIERINDMTFNYNDQKGKFDRWDQADGIQKMKKALGLSGTVKKEQDKRKEDPEVEEGEVSFFDKSKEDDPFANYKPTTGVQDSELVHSWDTHLNNLNNNTNQENQHTEKMEEETTAPLNNATNVEDFTCAGIYTIDNNSGSRFDRHEYMLDQIPLFQNNMINLVKDPKLKIIPDTNKDMIESIKDSFYLKKAHFIKEVIEISVILVRWIHVNIIEDSSLQVKQNTKGTVLVFCPGFSEIFYWIFTFKENAKLFGDNIDKEYLLIPLHSSNADEVQEIILQSEKNLSGQERPRKIIVATNIAESSITIPDAIYVVDFGLSKENFFDKTNFTEKLDLCWASKASFKQRAGRVGRMNTGYIFHLIPSAFYDQLHEYVQTELLRSPLEKVVLRIKYMHEKEVEKVHALKEAKDRQKKCAKALKRDHIEKRRILEAEGRLAERDQSDLKFNEVYTEHCRVYSVLKNQVKSSKKYIFRDPLRVLGRALEPPGHMNVASALENLLHTGCITQLTNLNPNSDDNNAVYDYQITILGEVYRDLPCNIYVCKLLLLGNLFDAYSECVTLAALIQSPKPLIRWDYNDTLPPSVRDKDYCYSVASDHLKMLENFEIFERHVKQLYEMESKLWAGRPEESQVMTWEEFLEDEREFHFYLCGLRKKAKRHDFLSEAQKILKIDVATGINIMEIRWDLVRRMKKKYFEKFNHELKVKEKAERILIAMAGAYFDQYLVAEFISERLRMVIRPESHFNSTISSIGGTTAAVDDMRCIIIRNHTLWYFLPLTSNAKEEMVLKNPNYSKYNMTGAQIYEIWMYLFKKEVMQKYGNVSQVFLDKTDIVIEFDQKTYHNAIRRLLHASVCAYEEQQRATRIYSSRTGSERVVDESQRRKPVDTNRCIHFSSNPNLNGKDQLEYDIKSVVQEFSDLFYKYEMQVSDLFYYRDVKIDVLSYSRIVLPEANKFDKTPKVIVAQSFYENESRKVTARGVSIMPTYHLMLPFLVMIFGVSIKLESDLKRERYCFVVHKEKSIELDYIMTKENLREVNLIRTCLRSFYLQLKQKNSELSMNIHKNVFDKIMRLLSTKRVRYLPRERWMEMFERDRHEYLAQLKFDHCKPANTSYIPFNAQKNARAAIRKKIAKQNNTNGEFSSHPHSGFPSAIESAISSQTNQSGILIELQRSEMNSMVNGTPSKSLEYENEDGKFKFYENIQDIPLDKNCNNFSDEGSLTFYKSYVEKYLEWKDEQVAELDRYKKMVSMNDAELLCGVCGAELFDAKHLMEPSANVIFWRIAEKARLYLDQLPEPIVQSQLSISNKLQQVGDHIKGYGCVRKHLIAISFNNLETKYLVFGIKLRIRWPDLFEQEFNISDFNRETLLNEQIDRKRNVTVPDRIHCKICDEMGIPKSELKSHMYSSKHRECERAFFAVKKDNFYQ